MLKLQFAESAKKGTLSAISLVQATVLIVASLLPLLLVGGTASAAQLTSRSVTITNSKFGAAVTSNMTFGWTMPTVSQNVQSISMQFCTTALGTCTAPTGLDVSASTFASQAGFPTNGTNFAARVGADAGTCTTTSAASNTKCFTRTQATAGGGAQTLVINTVTNPTVKTTVYVRVFIYNDAAGTFVAGVLVDSGTVAAAFVDQQTVTGRVQERLEFCVATILDAATVPTTTALCSALGTNAMDLGNIDYTSGLANVSPVAVGSGGDTGYGILMANSNGANGLNISFFPELESTGTNQQRSFRVVGAACSVPVATFTDQCFQETAGGATGTTISQGTEFFGLNIPCIDTSNASASTNLVVPAGSAGFNADGTTTSSANCQRVANDTSLKFGWDSSGTAVVLASSTAAAVKIVDREIVKVRYGATATATTPTGAYQVKTTFIATPIF